MKILFTVLLVPIFVIFLGVGVAELNKAYWDGQVRKLCRAYGGITIYESVALSEDEFTALGGVLGKPLVVPVKGASWANREPNFPYEMERITESIKKRNPLVWKHEAAIYRKSDKKVLGKRVSFVRRGGDFRPEYFMTLATVVGI
ncbi:hypothetical protein [Microbulbifer agarilyticus]|uniref:hypothetical protein n=1 Tax=Microbulbifer agarilyticus TaxID=260552 RepID=UPI0012FC62E9|nr:hypothetical protein [Microbulbifer agarilyticus]